MYIDYGGEQKRANRSQLVCQTCNYAQHEWEWVRIPHCFYTPRDSKRRHFYHYKLFCFCHKNFDLSISVANLQTAWINMSMHGNTENKAMLYFK